MDLDEKSLNVHNPSLIYMYITLVFRCSNIKHKLLSLIVSIQILTSMTLCKSCPPPSLPYKVTNRLSLSASSAFFSIIAIVLFFSKNSFSMRSLNVVFSSCRDTKASGDLSDRSFTSLLAPPWSPVNMVSNA